MLFTNRLNYVWDQTVFSTGFFNWFGDTEKKRVSNYVWIYFVITIGFTAATIGSWYYWVILRPRRRAKKELEGGSSKMAV
jgi:hypothetical protein